MATARETRTISDSRRDAKRYNRLLAVLDRAIIEIRAMQMEGSTGIDTVLDRLLPVLAGTLNAKDAFAALLREGENETRYLEITAAYPREDLVGNRLEYTDRFQKLIAHGKRIIIDPLQKKQKDIIPGLEVFGATSAVLVRMESADEKRVVGVCNKRNPESDVFLAADGMALDSIVELVAMGARIGERRRRELESIQKTSAAISSSLDLQEVLGTIAESIIQVTGCQKSAIFLLDKERKELNLEMDRGLSKEYVLGSRSLEVGPKTRAAVIFYGAPIAVRDTEAERRFTVYKELGCQEGFRALIDVPMKIKEETIGATTAYYAQPHDFSREEIDLLATFANQAAIAVQNAWLYERVQRRTAHLQALCEAGKVITARVDFDRKQILDSILYKAVESLTGVVGRKATLGTIQLFDEKTNELVFTNIYPVKNLSGLVAKLEDRLPLDRWEVKNGRIGVTGRAAITKQAQIVQDVREDLDYIEYNRSTKAELAVPVLDGNSLIGILNVESHEIGAFDEGDMEMLQGLADLAVVALKNAEQAEQLSRTRALALMGAWGTHVVHDVNREVGAIRRACFVAQRYSDLPPEVKGQLRNIDRYAEALALPEIPEQPLESGYALELRDAPLLDEVVRTEVDHIRPSYPHVSWRCELKNPRIRVAMHELWLRRLLRHLIHNAVKAIPRSKESRLVTIRTAVQGSMAEVQVEDTGKGVGPEIEPLLFRQPIPHEDGRRGAGLLVVGFLAEQYGGEAKLIWSRPGEGACFAFSVPLALETNGSEGASSNRN